MGRQGFHIWCLAVSAHVWSGLGQPALAASNALPWPAHGSDANLSAIENWMEPKTPAGDGLLPALPPVRPPERPSTRPIYRSFNGQYHFYSLKEDDSPNQGFSKEGVVFQLFEYPLTGMIPVWRCFDASRSRHFLGVRKCEGNEASRELLLGYVWSEARDGTKPLLQCYNAGIDNLFSTVSENECRSPGYRGTQAIGYL